MAPSGEAARGMQWRPMRVRSVERPSDSNVVLRLGIDPPGSFSFVAGQWVYVQLGQEGPDSKGAYSIASPPLEPNFLELCVKKVEGGLHSSWLYDRSVGDELLVSRAFGGFQFRSPPERVAVFLATGTGIAPLRSMLLDLLHRKDSRELWLFYGVGREVNLVYHDEFLALAQRHPSVHYVPVVSRASLEWKGERGWIQEPFLARFKHRTDFDAYVCGIKRMADDVVELLKTLRLPDAAIHFEKYV